MQASSSVNNTLGNGRPSPTVSVVIPALNEERNLPHVFAKLPADITEVIVVDGGSVDRTVEVARELRPDVKIVQQTRKGKGNALACGFAACTSDIIVMIDADGSTDPAEIPQFVAALKAGADFVKGSRFGADGHSHDITPLRKLGNDGLNLTVNVLFGTRFTDLCYGYNAFWARVVPTLALPEISLPQPADGSKLWGDGFEIETMINIRAAADGLKVAEVPSIEHARIHGESNLNTFRDGTRVLRTIMSEWFRARRLRRQAAKGVPAAKGPVTAAPAGVVPAAQPVLTEPAPAAAERPAARVVADHQVDPRPAHLNRVVRTADRTADRAADRAAASVTAEER
jgi:glycosyltransferase involved in cell wall biosynthesis